MTITITNLPLQSTVQDTTLIPVETSGITGHITALSLQSYLSSASLASVTATTGSFTSVSASTISAATLTIGAITASANITAQANVVVTNNVYASNLYATYANISNNLAVSGNETLGGNLSMSGAILFSSATVSAAGTNQGTATAVSADNVFVTGGTGGILLPSAVAGREISITNNTGSNITVYPASGHSIENNSANAGTVVPPYATLGLIAKSGNNWWTSQPVYNAGSGISITQSANGTVTWATTGVAASETLSTVSARGASTSANVTMSGGLNIGALYPTANASVNLGSTSGWFNTIYGTSTHAQYADLAECYESDATYAPGTVMIFGTDTEVTVSQTANDPAVAGVVSTNPAYLMNEQLTADHVVALALTGRVPCRVVGTVKRGDRMVTSSIPGVAMANNDPEIGTVIGKALGNYNSTEIGVIEVVVGRV